MTESAAELEAWLNDVMAGMGRLVKGFRPIGVRNDGERMSLVFRWFDDPNTYEIVADWSDGEFDSTDLEEDLDTGFLMAAIKTRSGSVLRADLQGERSPQSSGNFYLSAALEYVGHLAEDGLDTGPGLGARSLQTLLDWWAGYANNRTGGPALGQLVVVRDSEREAHIAHLELDSRAGDDLGYDLVFTAIHHAARRGIHRLYSPRGLAHIAPFEFAAASGRPDVVMYDITTRDMNWPRQLTSNSIGSRTPLIQDPARERAVELGHIRFGVDAG